MIGNITKTDIPTSNLTNGTTFSGSTSWANYTYKSYVTYVSGLLENTSYGINHNLSVSVNGVPAVDGLVAVIDVQITKAPPKSYAIFLKSQLFFCVIFLNCPFLGSHGDHRRLIYGNYAHFSLFLLRPSYQLQLFYSTMLF